MRKSHYLLAFFVLWGGISMFSYVYVYSYGFALILVLAALYASIFVSLFVFLNLYVRGFGGSQKTKTYTILSKVEEEKSIYCLFSSEKGPYVYAACIKKENFKAAGNRVLVTEQNGEIFLVDAIT